jgi:hypothetical protein
MEVMTRGWLRQKLSKIECKWAVPRMLQPRRRQVMKFKMDTFATAAGVLL